MEKNLLVFYVPHLTLHLLESNMTIQEAINKFLNGLADELDREFMDTKNSDYNKGVQDCINYILSQVK